MSPFAPRQTVQQSTPPAPKGRRRGFVTAVGVAAAIALTGSLAACDARDEGKASVAGAGSSTPNTTDAAVTSTAPEAPKADAGTTPKADAPKDEPKSGGGSTDKVAQDLLAHLKTTKHGALVSEVRIAKTYDKYDVSINTTLPAEVSLSDDLKGESARMDKADKLATEAMQWTQDKSTLAIGSVQVYDKEKGSAGIANGGVKDSNKAASDAYAGELLAQLKTTTHGGLITQIRITKSYSNYDVAINTTLPAEVSLSENLAAESARMDKADKLATEAKQWVETHTSVKVTSIKVLDKDKGMAGIANVG